MRPSNAIGSKGRKKKSENRGNLLTQKGNTEEHMKDRIALRHFWVKGRKKV